jgi:hypothetical protein
MEGILEGCFEGLLLGFLLVRISEGFLLGKPDGI